MNKFLIAAFACFVVPASAADLKLKAPAPAPFISAYPYETGGFYFGVGTVGETEKVNFAGATNTFASGGALSATVGYTRPLSVGSWVAVEGTVAYANMGTDNACPIGSHCSFSSKLSGELMAKYGGNLSSLSSLIPNIGSAFPTLPSVPVGAENPLVHPYIGAGILYSRDELLAMGGSDKNMRARGIMRVGFLTQKNNGTVVDTWAEWAPANGNISLPNFQAEAGSRYRVGLAMFWGMSKN